MPDVLPAFVAAGLWPGLPAAFADRLAAAGLRTAPDVSAGRLASVPDIDQARAAQLAKGFAALAPAVAVAELLAAAALPLRLAPGAVAALGADAERQLRLDPWRILRAGSVRPEQADRLAASLLERPSRDDPRRGAALTEHILARAARDGHTVLPTSAVVAALAGLHVPDPPAALAAAAPEGRVLRLDEGAVVGLARYAMAEEALADGVARLLSTAAPLVPPSDVAAGTAGLDAAQGAAVAHAMAHGVSVLTGGPGTGKSRTVAAIAALATAHEVGVALAAPTGRAAKRLEELSDAPASTVHRLLGADGEGGFARGESWPLDAGLVIVDEASMLDVEVAAALVEACPDGAHLVLVGDPAQLPSIGPGRVLGDLIDSHAVPVGELTTLHRQAAGGGIARLAGAVRAGTLAPLRPGDREVVVVPAADAADAARRVVQLVTDSIPRVFAVPAAEVQVVTPVHRGAAGTSALNAALKAVLNPGPGQLAGFDPGDRVVATVNHLTDGFANGDIGTVVEIRDGRLVVDFTTGRVTVAPTALPDLRHGWALTVHRAQGSEWAAVVAVLPPEAAGLLSRPLVYTALTRARRHLSIVHAAGPALVRAVQQVGSRPRRTRLQRLLTDS